MSGYAWSFSSENDSLHRVQEATQTMLSKKLLKDTIDAVLLDLADDSLSEVEMDEISNDVIARLEDEIEFADDEEDDLLDSEDE